MSNAMSATDHQTGLTPAAKQRADIAALIERLRACTKPNTWLDHDINNTFGIVKQVSTIGLNGRGSRTRYFGPKSDPFGRGAAVPKPTKTQESRAKAIEALTRLALSLEVRAPGRAESASAEG
jgi:hypothetical protein